MEVSSWTSTPQLASAPPKPWSGLFLCDIGYALLLVILHGLEPALDLLAGLEVVE